MNIFQNEKHFFRLSNLVFFPVPSGSLHALLLLTIQIGGRLILYYSILKAFLSFSYDFMFDRIICVLSKN